MANKRPSVFLDTSFFKALVDPKDEFHSQAHDINAALIKNHVTLVTTNYILDETFTLIRKRCGLQKAQELREKIAEHSFSIQVIRISASHDAKAWVWFKNSWSDLSFTDCVSFVIMKQRDIVLVATFDHHFKQAGFTIVGIKTVSS